jgi:hypothetical protein
MPTLPSMPKYTIEFTGVKKVHANKMVIDALLIYRQNGQGYGLLESKAPARRPHCVCCSAWRRRMRAPFMGSAGPCAHGCRAAT